MNHLTSRTDRESMVAAILNARERELRFMQTEIMQLKNLLAQIRLKNLQLAGR